MIHDIVEAADDWGDDAIMLDGGADLQDALIHHAASPSAIWTCCLPEPMSPSSRRGAGADHAELADARRRRPSRRSVTALL